MSDLHDHQQVNLLDRGFRRRQVVLPAQLLVSLTLLAVAGLLAYYFVHRSQVAALEGRVARLEADYSQQQAAAAQRREQAGQGPEAADLDRRIARLTEEKRAKGHVLNLLAGPSTGTTGGFSAYLEGLARQTQSGVWLRHIAIGHGGSDLSLAGSALDPKLVPRYLKRLSGEPVYAGRAFRTFKMTRRAHAATAVDFAVKTGAPED